MASHDAGLLPNRRGNSVRWVTQHDAMPMVNRRVVLGGIAAFSIGRPAYAETPQDFSVEADDESVALTRYAADQVGKRPAVVVLHGSRGVELKPRAYQRYADALNAIGIDAYLARYFTASDLQVFDPKTSTRQRREAYETQRFEGWTKRVSSAVTAVLARPESSGRIGLLGLAALSLPGQQPRMIASRHWPCSTAECRTRWSRESSVCRR